MALTAIQKVALKVTGLVVFCEKLNVGVGFEMISLSGLKRKGACLNFEDLNLEDPSKKLKLTHANNVQTDGQDWHNIVGPTIDRQNTTTNLANVATPGRTDSSDDRLVTAPRSSQMPTQRQASSPKFEEEMSQRAAYVEKELAEAREAAAKLDEHDAEMAKKEEATPTAAMGRPPLNEIPESSDSDSLFGPPQNEIPNFSDSGDHCPYIAYKNGHGSDWK